MDEREPEPMSMADFAKFVGITEKAIFAMSYTALTAFLKLHGYHCTGVGILPLGWGPA